MHEKITPFEQLAVHLGFLISAAIAHKLRWTHVKRSAGGVGRALWGLASGGQAR
jgi:hypothetical protein